MPTDRAVPPMSPARPATAIEGAVAARSISSRKDERVAAEAAYDKRAGGKSDVSLADLEKALLAGKIVSYAQGFAVMQKASEDDEIDDEVESFMGASSSTRPGSSGDDLDCVHSLLSLSQGNWR